MSMVAMALYNPSIPAGDPETARTFLPCNASRMTIIKVRRTLSEIEIATHGILKSKTTWGISIKRPVTM